MYDLYKQTLKKLAKAHPNGLGDDSDLSKIVFQCAQSLSKAEQAETEIEELVEDNYDDLYGAIFDAPESETVISLSFDDEFISASNSITEYRSLFFFRGTDLDDAGPFDSLEDALANSDVFYSERQEPCAQLYFRNDVSLGIVVDILSSLKGCHGLELINENGTIGFDDRADLS